MTAVAGGVIVTAGASGIGRAIVEGFLKAGEQVHVADIDAGAVHRLLEEEPGATATVTDVADADSVARMVDGALSHLGGVNALVNCAGTSGPTAAIEDIPPDDWRRCVAVNLDGTYLCTKYVVPVMKAAGRGSIVNISSTAGFYGYPLRSPYAASKWALIGLTKSLAMELGPFGIRVNVVCPGSVDGPRMDSVIAAEAAQKGMDEESVRQRYARASSLRTFVSADDIADMTVFLCSAKARQVTGQAIAVDGHTENIATLED